MKNVADKAEPNNPPQQIETKEVEILEEVPASLQRPLSLIDGHAYAVAWVNVRTTTRRISSTQTNDDPSVEPATVSDESVRLIIRHDGVVFTDADISGARPLADLELKINLREPPPANRSWSGAGVNRFLSGERPNPADIFRCVVQVVDRFMDFNRSLADQRTMCELNACFVLATYFLDGFNVIGYLWPNGDRGTGKTGCCMSFASRPTSAWWS